MIAFYTVDAARLGGYASAYAVDLCLRMVAICAPVTPRGAAALEMQLPACRTLLTA